MVKSFACFVAAFCCAGTAGAATVGLPIFTTAPVNISFVNEFQGNLPSSFYSMSLTTTIATADGAPELVGQSLAFTFSNSGFASLSIGGMSLSTGVIDENTIGFEPPVASDTIDPISGRHIFTFDSPFQGFGPLVADFLSVAMQFSFDQALPTIDERYYCTAGLDYCEASSIVGLTEISGRPVSDFGIFHYVEGDMFEATVTFATVNGRPVAPVPLPASGLFLLGAIVGLRSVVRRK